MQVINSKPLVSSVNEEGALFSGLKRAPKAVYARFRGGEENIWPLDTLGGSND